MMQLPKKKFTFFNFFRAHCDCPTKGLDKKMHFLRKFLSLFIYVFLLAERIERKRGRDEQPFGYAFLPNQIVAYNLFIAKKFLPVIRWNENSGF